MGEGSPILNINKQLSWIDPQTVIRIHCAGVGKSVVCKTILALVNFFELKFACFLSLNIPFDKAEYLLNQMKLHLKSAKINNKFLVIFLSDLA